MHVAISEKGPSIPRFVRFMVLASMAIIITLMTMGLAHADDILAPASGTVNDTFGQNSTLARWIILAEVLVGAFMYIKTKNLMLLFGVIVVVVFTTIGFQLAA